MSPVQETKFMHCLINHPQIGLTAKSRTRASYETIQDQKSAIVAVAAVGTEYGGEK